MGKFLETKIFNNPKKIVAGWYWALQSKELKIKKTKAIQFLGEELTLYRGEDGVVRALEAYCPHMGAHLSMAKVEGNSLRCFFHNWKFDSKGVCVEIPCQKATSFVKPLKTWNVEEKYGLVWIGAGDVSGLPIPFVPEFEGVDVEAKLGKPFIKGCHPNVMMINAIDAQHFNSVHQIPVHLNLEPQSKNSNWIIFENTTKIPEKNFLQKLISRFYKNSLTYILSYWYGSTGSVTVGPDFLHFHIIFALRPTEDGRSEGQTILVTKARHGFFGKILNSLLLFLTSIVGNYFAKGDTLIFETIQFNFAHPIKADSSIISFIEHVENQVAYDRI